MTQAIIGWAIALGLILGLGLWSLVMAVPAFSRPSLADRVAPLVIDVSPEAREHANRRERNPLPVIGSLFSPVVVALQNLIGQVLGGNDTVRLRLRQAGKDTTVDEFRAKQAVWGILGGLTGLVLTGALFASRGGVNIAQVALPVVGLVFGVLLCDWMLRNDAERRLERIASEFPTVIEFLTLSLSAGEGIHDSIRRVARVSSGELASEFRRVIARTSSGVPLGTALTDLGRELQYLPLERCADHLVAALERGAPLVEVLRSQARDARDVAKRDLLESAGRKEISMMVPLVFLILPVTVAFAVWPGLFVLNTSF